MLLAQNPCLLVNAIPEKANIGLGYFGGDYGELVHIGQDRQKILSEVYDLDTGSGTPMAHAIHEVAYEALTAQAQKQAGYGEYHIVIVTDGKATDDNLEGVVRFILQNTPIVIHTIGLGIGENHSLNQPGRIDYKAADDLTSLRKTLSDVLAEAPTFDVSQF